MEEITKLTAITIISLIGIAMIATAIGVSLAMVKATAEEPPEWIKTAQKWFFITAVVAIIIVGATWMIIF